MGFTADALAQRMTNAVEILRAFSAAVVDDDGTLGTHLRETADYLDAAACVLTLSIGDRPPSISARRDETGRFSLRGVSELLSITEFIGYLSRLGRNGVLQVQSDAEDFVIQIHGGCVMFATGENPHGLRLRQILTTTGKISPVKMSEVLQHGRVDEYLGESLVRLGVVSLDDLIEALTYQVTMTFCRMHAIGAGFRFQFEEGTKVLETPDIRLPIADLLANTSHLMEEAKVVLADARDGEHGV